MAYSAYGELLTEKVSGFGYNGEYYDAAMGMLNLRARQYEPAQARFSQRDSLKGWVTSPRSLNAYLYCQNDAMNYFDASGAAMMAVNMTDGGGGKKSNSSSSNLLQKAGQTIKSVVSTVASAAAVAKAVNDQALKKGLVNSILKESRDPVAQLQRVRENRAQAQATTPTVSRNTFLRGTKTFACMTQEEYDAGLEVYGPPLPSGYVLPTTPQPIEDYDTDGSAVSWKKVWAYLKRTGKSLLLGDYSDEDPTLLSIAGNIAAGFFDYDLPLDVRDAIYDISHIDELERPWLRLGIDIIALIPVIGALKYVDDLADLAKHTDDIADIAKYSDDVFDYVRRSDDVADLVDGLGDGTKHLDDMSDAAKIADDIGDAAKFTEKQVMDYVEMATKGPIDSDIVVLGKNIENSADSYQEVAKRMNAQYFDLENWGELSATYSDDELWRINEEFISKQIDSGKEILLSSNPNIFLGDGSGYGKELQYLDDHGYIFIEIGENLWRAIKGN